MSREVAIPPGFVWTYPACVDEVHDGDTIVLHIVAHPNEGGEFHDVHVRVEGINAPELNTAAGTASRDYAETLLPEGAQVVVISRKRDKYGRFLARITLPDGRDFGDEMVAAGHAVPYLT